MYLDNYHCDWERVQIVLKNDDDTACDSVHFNHPRQMWDRVLGQYVQYCPADANRDFQLSLGDEVQVTKFIEGDVLRVTFTRPDGYQIAIIKFLMEG